MHNPRTVGHPRWLLTTLGAALAAVWACSAVAADRPETTRLHVKVDSTTASILSRPDAGPVLEYRFAEVTRKPYASQLFTPGGVPVLRDSPVDHTHHHALMFAVAIDGVDFWSETPECGIQAHRKLDIGAPSAAPAAAPRASSAEIIDRIDWLKPDKTLLAREQRAIRAYSGDELGVSLLTWQTRLEPAPGKDSMVLSGSHYFGLGVRFVVSMDQGGRLLTPDGKLGDVVRGSERLTRAAWCAYSAAADGKPVTVAIFDHPKNPRHPAEMFTMTEPFGYLSATLNLSKEPMTVKAGEPLVLRYGVAAWDGQVEPAKIAETYQRWLRLAP